jgi:hypothetical protein
VSVIVWKSLLSSLLNRLYLVRSFVISFLHYCVFFFACFSCFSYDWMV